MLSLLTLCQLSISYIDTWSYFWGIRREVCKAAFNIWGENDTELKGEKKISLIQLKKFFTTFETKTSSGWWCV